MSHSLEISNSEVEKLPLDPAKRSHLDQEAKNLKLVFCLTGCMILLLVALIIGLMFRPINIEKPITDSREYRYVKLDNGIRAVLISDKETSISAASLSLDGGYFTDPWDLPGLTHYIEHMLFISSKKFPSVNSFWKLVSENGGMANAQTSPEDTTYYFQIANGKFKDALEIFSHFFIDPLFEQEYMDKELHVIESEFQQYFDNEEFKLYYMAQISAGNDKVFSRFKCGNVDSLKNYPEKLGVNVRDRMIQHFKNIYSANLMTLTILGSKSLDKLEKYANKYFGKIENKYKPAPEYDMENLFGKLPRVLAYAPITQMARLSIIFSFKQDSLVEMVRPFDFFFYILSSENEGSLKYKLLEKGWILDISRVEYVRNSRTSNVECIHFILTKKGIDHVYEILQLYYGLLAKLSSNEELERIYADAQTILQTEFDYKLQDVTAAEYVKFLSLNMKHGKPEQAISKADLLHKFDLEVVKDFFANTVSLNNSLIIISCPGINASTDSKVLKFDSVQNKLDFSYYNLKDDFYRLNYAVYEPEENFIEGILKFNYNQYSLPSKNPFAPQQFNLIGSTVRRIDSDLSPVKVKDGVGYSIWHTEFNLNSHPYSVLKFNLYFDNSCQALQKRASMLIFNEHMKNEMNEYLAIPKNAGYNIVLNNHIETLELEISGFSDQILNVARHIWQFNLFEEISQDSFNKLKKSAHIQISNAKLDSLFSYALAEIDRKLSLCYFSYEDLKGAIKDMSYETYIIELKEISNYLTIDALALGNIRKEDAIREISSIIDNFKITAKRNIIHQMTPTSDSSAFHVMSQFGGGFDHISLNYYYKGERDLKTNAVLKIFENKFSAYAMTELRTKQALGYVAYASQEKNIYANAFYILVQGSEFDPFIFDREIEKVIKGFENVLVCLEEDDLKELKKGVISKTYSLETNLFLMGDIWARELRFGSLQFDFAERIREEVEKLTKEDILQAYKEFFSSSTRLSYQVYDQKSDFEQNLLLSGNQTYSSQPENMIKNLADWK